MKNIVFFILASVVLYSCLPSEEKINFNGDLSLSFNTDTLFFDTLFINTMSKTKKLKIQNPNKNAIKIDKIHIATQQLSPYLSILNGKKTSEISNEVLLGKDSLQLLVSVAIPTMNQNEPFLLKDSIVIEWNQNKKNIILMAWGQATYTHSKDTICNEKWTADRPYIIAENTVVKENCTLEIEKGTRIFFHQNKSLHIAGTLLAIGTPKERVLFQGINTLKNDEQSPGFWNGLSFTDTSKENKLTYCDIFNAKTGIKITKAEVANHPDITLEGCIIANTSEAGISAIKTNLTAQNTLIYNGSQYLAGHFGGGKYLYQHCTFSNQPTVFFRNTPSVQFANAYKNEKGETTTEDLTLSIQNSIIWGNELEELLITKSENSTLLQSYENVILKSEKQNSQFIISQSYNFPGFSSPENYDFSLDSLSIAKDKGTNMGIATDLEGKQRDSQPDIGAYEYVKNSKK